jgi:hypothetical protein
MTTMEMIMMVVVVMNAPNTVKVFITIMIHHDDRGFALHCREKQQLEYFIIQSFSRLTKIRITMVTNTMSAAPSDAIEKHFISL